MLVREGRDRSARRGAAGPAPARSGDEHRRRGGELRDAFDVVPIDQAILERAVGVQRELAERGCHRGISQADLLTAACAEARGLTVLHYDRDFDQIAEVTGQPVDWVVPRGSVP